MDSKSKLIVIDLFETIRCPDCGHTFPLSEGISESTVKAFSDAYTVRIQEESRKLAAVISVEETRKAESVANAKVDALNRQLRTATEAADKAKTEAEAKAQAELQRVSEAAKLQLATAQRSLAEKEAALKQTQELVAKAQRDAKASANEEFAAHRKMLEDQVVEQKKTLESLRAKEVDFLKEKASLDQARAELELRVQRQLEEERKKIREEVTRFESEKNQLSLAELRKKLDDAQHANDELTRKLSQGSQQIQGEVLEMEIETRLHETYRTDVIEPVPNGVRGADVVQRVVTQTGQQAGTIVWEAKRAAKWSNDWVAKLKKDSESLEPTLCILVTTTMPKAITGAFGRIDGVYVIAEHLFGAFAEIARVFVLRQHQLALSRQATADQMARVFEYVVNGSLGDRLNAIHQEASRLGEDLTRERNYMQTTWKRRETHLRQLTTTLNDIRGELLALCDQAVAKLAPPAEVVGEVALVADAKPQPMIQAGGNVDGTSTADIAADGTGPAPDVRKTA